MKQRTAFSIAMVVYVTAALLLIDAGQLAIRGLAGDPVSWLQVVGKSTAGLFFTCAGYMITPRIPGQ